MELITNVQFESTNLQFESQKSTFNTNNSIFTVALIVSHRCSNFIIVFDLPQNMLSDQSELHFLTLFVMELPCFELVPVLKPFML